eukprot:Gb_40343 [translate_table: standard]
MLMLAVYNSDNFILTKFQIRNSHQIVEDLYEERKLKVTMMVFLAIPNDITDFSFPANASLLRFYSICNQVTLQANAVRHQNYNSFRPGKTSYPVEAKGGCLNLQIYIRNFNGREYPKKRYCSFLNNVETCVESVSEFNENSEPRWCSLCGGKSGWMTCGKCGGEGGFSTRPGLGGVSGKVRWALCKTCFGRGIVPCLLCGNEDLETWQQGLKSVRSG